MCEVKIIQLYLADSLLLSVMHKFHIFYKFTSYVTSFPREPGMLFVTEFKECVSYSVTVFLDPGTENHLLY